MPFILEREALIASGIRDDHWIAEYSGMLGSFCHRFTLEQGLSSSILVNAKKLFEWLWKDSPTRYRPHGNYRLHKVIDSQISGGAM